jgi:hypothetical protein
VLVFFLGLEWRARERSLKKDQKKTENRRFQFPFLATHASSLFYYLSPLPALCFIFPATLFPPFLSFLLSGLSRRRSRSLATFAPPLNLLSAPASSKKRPLHTVLPSLSPLHLYAHLVKHTNSNTKNTTPP